MPTILVVDDNPLNLDVLVNLLNKYKLIVSTNAHNGLKLLEEHSIDLILLDIMMPEMDGMSMAKVIKSNPETASIPIIFITAKHDDETIEEGFKNGAVDYITKPFRPIELQARVETHIDLNQTIKALEFAANRDYLTGAYNRRSFFNFASEMFADDTDFTLFAVMIDIDKFKNVNDTFGHQTGDLVIKALSDSIHGHMKPSMLCARMGGEEFAVLLKESDEDAVVSWVEKLRVDVGELEVQTESANVKLNISCGIALHESSHESIDALLDQADKSLYVAKEGGRNRVVFRLR